MRSLIERNMTSVRRWASRDGMPSIQSRSVDPVPLCDVACELELGQRAADVAGRTAGRADELVDRRRQGREQLVVDRILARREAVDVEHVRRTGERCGAELEQRVRPRGERTADLARYREHLAALFEREVGGDQRPAPLARLDDDGRAAEPGDDP